MLVPQGKDLYGSLDEAMGHRRRFSSADLAQALGQAGFEVLAFYQLNKIGALSWWIFGKLLGRKRISKPALKLFDKTVWFWRRVDGLLPWLYGPVVLKERAAEAWPKKSWGSSAA